MNTRFHHFDWALVTGNPYLFVVAIAFAAIGAASQLAFRDDYSIFFVVDHQRSGVSFGD
jgi:hypothetical protein